MRFSWLVKLGNLPINKYLLKCWSKITFGLFHFEGNSLY
jgi:hypothetical protein